MKKLVIILFALLTVLQLKAQNHINGFLAGLYIKDLKLNSTITELQKNKELNNNLNFDFKEDNISTYHLKNQQIDFFSLDTINEAFLDFEGDYLKRISFEILGDLDDGKFKRTYELLKSKYGEPVSFPMKNSLYNRYVWQQEDEELILKPLKISFLITFMKKKSQSKHWIYVQRKGKGKALVQLNLHNWEKLVNSNLTINKFENYLPEWTSSGTHNHIKFGLNEKTGEMDIPQFLIDYKLDNYSIEITTADTVSKTITDYKFYNIKSQEIVNDIKKDIINSNYKLNDRAGFGYVTFYDNDLNKTMIMVDDDDKGISFKISNF